MRTDQLTKLALGAVVALATAACEPTLRGTVAVYSDSTIELATGTFGRQHGSRTMDPKGVEMYGVLPGKPYELVLTASVSGSALVRDLDFFLGRQASSGVAPEAIEVSLGTNDVCSGWSVATSQNIAHAFDAFMEATAPAPVFWLALTGGISCPNVGSVPERIEQWNLELASAARRHERLHVLRPEGLKLHDGLHFDPASATEAARIFVRALDAHFAKVENTRTESVFDQLHELAPRVLTLTSK